MPLINGRYVPFLPDELLSTNIRPQPIPPPPQFERGDEVVWNDQEWSFQGIYQMASISYPSGLGYLTAPGRTPHVASMSEIKPFNIKPDPNLKLYKISVTRKNWQFTGYKEAIVVAKNSAQARNISPSGGIIQSFPVEGWTNSPQFIEAKIVGLALEGMKENTVISSCVEGE